jgi:hypothetical protein
MLVFEVSPQGFGHEVWQKLALIRINGTGVMDPAVGH